jgi:hypothetical protein
MTGDSDALREQVASNGAEGQLLARIDVQMEHVIASQDRAEVERAAMREDVTIIKVSQSACAARQVAKWEEQERVNDDLRQKKNIGDAVAYLIGGIATALSALGLKGGA